MIGRSIYAGFHLVGLFTATIVAGFSPVLPLGQRPSLHLSPPPLRCPSFLRSTRAASQGRSSNTNISNLDSPNPWIVLGLREAATRHVAEIKLRYKHLAMLYHPDRTPHATPAEKQMASDRFAKINCAYQTAKAVIDAKQRNNDSAPSGHWSRTSRSDYSRTSSASSSGPFAKKSPFAKKHHSYTQSSYETREATAPPPPPYGTSSSSSSSAYSRRGESTSSNTKNKSHASAKDFWSQRRSSSSSSTSSSESYASTMSDDDYQSVWSRNGNKGWYDVSYGTSSSSHNAETSSTDTAEDEEEGWTQPHQSPEDFKFRNHGGNHHAHPHERYETSGGGGGAGWTQPHQSPEDSGFRNYNKQQQNQGWSVGGPDGGGSSPWSSANAAAPSWAQQPPPPRTNSSPPNSRETTRTTRSSSSSGGNVSPDLGWTRPRNHQGDSSSSKSASYASSSSPRSSTTKGREYVSSEFWQKCKTVNDGDNNNKVNINSDDGSFASGYISRFGNVGAAAVGGVFEELVHFLEQHLSHDAALHWLFKSGTIEEIGQEMDDMQLIAQSLSMIHTTIEKELAIHTRRQSSAERKLNDQSLDEHIIEMERRWKMLTDYQAKTQQRLATIEHKYWAMVWDQARRRTPPPPPPPQHDFPSNAFNDLEIDGGNYREPEDFGSRYGGLRP